MRRAALALAASFCWFTAAAGSGCKRKPPPPVGGSAAASGDAGATGGGDGGEPEEADVRFGKRTGLGAADEKPEVATEPLVRALVRAEVPWSRVVDAAGGVVELRAIPATDTATADEQVVRRCGPLLEQTVTGFAAAVNAALAATGLIYDVVCDNVGLAVSVPGVASHAVCSVSSPSGDGLEYDLVFIPDPTLGLRLIGLSTADAVATGDQLRDRFDEELGRYGAGCP